MVVVNAGIGAAADLRCCEATGACTSICFNLQIIYHVLYLSELFELDHYSLMYVNKLLQPSAVSTPLATHGSLLELKLIALHSSCVFKFNSF